MKYVYTGGAYREFRGYVFANGKPVTIKDKGTLAALANQRDFLPVEDDETPEVKVEEVVIPPPAAAPENACPKCGKVLKRQGAHFHIRACKR